MKILVLYNEPFLPKDHKDRDSEEGVLWTVTAISEALEQRGHSVSKLGLGQTLAPLISLANCSSRPDVVFNLCEGLRGTGEGEPKIAAVLELLDLPFTGSSSDALSLTRNKARTKWLLRGAGVETAPFTYISSGEAIPRDHLLNALSGGPLIVKPALEDASIGISRDSVVTTAERLSEQIDRVRQQYGDTLVERFIDGREINVSVYAVEKTARVLPFSEIHFATNDAFPWAIVSYEAKWHSKTVDYQSTPAKCPTEVEPELAARLQRVALDTFRLTQCRDYARVDTRVAADGSVYVLEINANPDISPTSGYADALDVAGIAYAEFADRLIKAAYSRRRPTGKESVVGNSTSVPASFIASRTQQSAISFRDVQSDDVEHLTQLLSRCGNFRQEEIAVGREILEEAVVRGPEGDYRVIVAEKDGVAVGWSCHGLVALTDGAYDLYWIAVEPACHGQGIGSKILEEIERRLRSVQARWLIAETSDLPSYDATNAFYLRKGFERSSIIPDFYRAGDGRLTYIKRLDGNAQPATAREGASDE